MRAHPALPRLVLAAMLVLTTFMALGCGSRQGRSQQRRLTGTCEGACNHYTACKRSDSDTLFAACYDECTAAFSDSESLMGFESLTCLDAVAYVEGANGRMPGEPPPSTVSN